MRKHEELSDPNSCWNKARPNEMLFVLLGRDVTASGTVHDWAERRIKVGKNTREDPQITEAYECAYIMDMERGSELEQARLQLAGCLTAAEGHTKDVAKQGDHSWSPAYQAVLDLRRKYDELRACLPSHATPENRKQP